MGEDHLYSKGIMMTDESLKTPPPILSVQALRVEYPGQVAVDDVSFTLHPGTICALIGPNGAGKTSMMRSIVGLLEPTWGEIKVGPHLLSNQREEATLQIGFMPADPPIYEDLSVYEFLELFASSYQIPLMQRAGKIAELLRSVGLEEKRDALAGSLSTGMRQRLFLARTLIHDPPLLILDEPASGLDPKARTELSALLERLAEEGRAILISSHILTELDAFCTHALILEQGRCVAFDQIEALHRQGEGTREVHISLIESASDAEWEVLTLWLQERELLSSTQRVRGACQVEIPSEEAAAQLLRELITTTELPVSHFATQSENLQSLFLSMSEGKTQ